MLHVRDAYQEVLEMLKAYPEARGNVHFFAGDWTIAQQFLARNFTLSFTGVITFSKKTPDVKVAPTSGVELVIKNTPLDQLMVETDAPYVAPVPYRGQRNEPLYVREVIKKVAELKGLTVGEVQAATLANARRVFGLIA